MEAKVTLSGAIENIREEISRAIENGEGKTAKFLLKEIDLELSIEAESRDGLSGKVQWVVVNIGAEQTASAKNIHRIKIKLTPVDGDGAPFIVSGQRQRPE